MFGLILRREVKRGAEQRYTYLFNFYLVHFFSSWYFSHLPIPPWILCSRNHPLGTLRFNGTIFEGF